MSNLILLSEFRKTEIELWKPVVGYPDYEVSNLGRVRSYCESRRPLPKRDRGVVRKPFAMMTPNRSRTDDHYLEMSLRCSIKRRGRTMKVHRLVAEAFIPNPENKPFVNHKTGNKADARADNLEWATFKENREHAMGHGMYPRGETHGMSILNAEDVQTIRGRFSEGLSVREIRAMYPQVKWATIYAIVKRYSWRHLT